MEAFKPAPNKLLVEKEEPPTMTKSGLHLPPSTHEGQKRGKVIAIGQGCTVASKDEVVVFGSYAGCPVTLLDDDDKKDYLVLTEEDILGTVKSES